MDATFARPVPYSPSAHNPLSPATLPSATQSFAAPCPRTPPSPSPSPDRHIAPHGLRFAPRRFPYRRFPARSRSPGYASPSSPTLSIPSLPSSGRRIALPSHAPHHVFGHPGARARFAPHRDPSSGLRCPTQRSPSLSSALPPSVLPAFATARIALAPIALPPIVPARPALPAAPPRSAWLRNPAPGLSIALQSHPTHAVSASASRRRPTQPHRARSAPPSPPTHHRAIARFASHRAGLLSASLPIRSGASPPQLSRDPAPSLTLSASRPTLSSGALRSPMPRPPTPSRPSRRSPTLAFPLPASSALPCSHQRFPSHLRPTPPRLARGISPPPNPPRLPALASLRFPDLRHPFRRPGQPIASHVLPPPRDPSSGLRFTSRSLGSQPTAAPRHRVALPRFPVPHSAAQFTANPPLPPRSRSHSPRRPAIAALRTRALRVALRPRTGHLAPPWRFAFLRRPIRCCSCRLPASQRPATLPMPIPLTGQRAPAPSEPSLPSVPADPAPRSPAIRAALQPHPPPGRLISPRRHPPHSPVQPPHHHVSPPTPPARYDSRSPIRPPHRSRIPPHPPSGQPVPELLIPAPRNASLPPADPTHRFAAASNPTHSPSADAAHDFASVPSHRLSGRPISLSPIPRQPGPALPTPISEKQSAGARARSPRPRFDRLGA